MSELYSTRDRIIDIMILRIITTARDLLESFLHNQSSSLDENFMEQVQTLCESSAIYKVSSRSLETCQALCYLTKLITIYNPRQKHPKDFLHLPIITWLRVPDFPKPVELFPAQHSFCSKDEHRMVKRITFKDIKHLKHATSARGLAQILGSNTEFGVLKPNSENDSNIAASGLLCCGVDVKFSDAERNQLPKYVNENRYGSCVLSFTVPSMDSPSTKCFILGTKFYIKEHCQAILVDAFGLSNQYGVIIDDELDKIHKCDEIVDKTDFNWDLNYEVNYWRDGKWTNPEVVFPHNLQLMECANLKIEFIPHECIKRKMCRECEFWTTKILRAMRVDRRGTYVGYEEFQGSLHDISSPTDLAIFVFALSIRPGQRLELIWLQEEKSVFKQEQFLRMQFLWNKYEDHYFEFLR